MWQYAVSVGAVVLAVRRLDHEIALAADLYGRLPRETVSVAVDLAYGVCSGAGVHGNSAHGVDLDIVHLHHVGRDGVLGLQHALRDDVIRLLRLGVAYLVMEVGPHRRTRITRSGDLLAARHAKLVGRADYVDPTASEAVPLGEDEVGDILAEPRQMAVNGGSAVGMGDVKRKAVPRRRLQNARHVTVCRRHDRLALHAVGLDVDPRMEMARADLAEVGRVEPRHPFDRVAVGVGIEALGRGTARTEQGR